MEKVISSTNYDENSQIDGTSRVMDDEAMHRDLGYRIAQRMAADMLEKGLITEKEFKRLTEMNKESYSPYLKELLA
jgi:hypothetical protein